MILHGEKVDGFVVDHINGDSTYNKRSNLRVVTIKVNNQNKNSKNSLFGLYGVNYIEIPSRWGRCKIYRCFTATWYNDKEKQNRKTFNIDILGIMEAFKQAVICRADAIKKLNRGGMGYTERHASNLTKHQSKIR